MKDNVSIILFRNIIIPVPPIFNVKTKARCVKCQLVRMCYTTKFTLLYFSYITLVSNKKLMRFKLNIAILYTYPYD